MKRILSILLALVMAVSLCGCGAEKNDAGFIKNLQKGLESRLKIESGAPSYLSKENYTNAVAAEKNAIGDIAVYTFEDAELKQLAEAYVAALTAQEESISLFNSNHAKFSEKYYSDGYYERARIICRLCDDYGFTVNEKYAAELREFTNNGRFYIALDSIANSGLVLESLGGSHSEIVIDNPSDFDFANLSVNFNLFDEDGVLIGTMSTYIDNLKSGAKIKKEVYAQQEFSAAELSMELYVGSNRLATEYYPVTYVNNMHVDIELITELPQEFSDLSWGREYTRGIINTFSYSINSWYEGKAYVELSISGEKTYDREGEENTRSCQFDWKLCDKSGVVVDTGTFYTSNLKVGETFMEATSSVSKVPVGEYMLEIMDSN